MKTDLAPGLDLALVERTYEALRRLAHRRMLSEPPDHTLDATSLVHEAMLRIRDGAGSKWKSEGHFYAAAAEAMRRILIERARRVRAMRHGGDLIRINVDDIDIPTEPQLDDLLALDEALAELQRHSARRAQLVKLRFFAGATIEESARALSISTATAKNDWRFARAWLRTRLQAHKGDAAHG